MTDWRDAAYCLDLNPELFFPDSRDLRGIRKAKDFCAKCVVRQTCLQDALDNGSAYGVAGGLSEDERRNLTRRSHRKAEEQKRTAENAERLHQFLARIGPRPFTAAEYAESHSLPLHPAATHLGNAVRFGQLEKVGVVRTDKHVGCGELQRVAMYRAVAS